VAALDACWTRNASYDCRGVPVEIGIHDVAPGLPDGLLFPSAHRTLPTVQGFDEAQGDHRRLRVAVSQNGPQPCPSNPANVDNLLCDRRSGDCSTDGWPQRLLNDASTLHRSAHLENAIGSRRAFRSSSCSTEASYSPNCWISGGVLVDPRRSCPVVFHRPGRAHGIGSSAGCRGFFYKCIGGYPGLHRAFARPGLRRTSRKYVRCRRNGSVRARRGAMVIYLMV